MPVIPEIPALKFKLNAHPLPPPRADLPLSFAVGIPSLHRFDQVAELLGYHSKQEYHALLVDRLVPHPAKVHGVAIGGPIRYLCASPLVPRNRRTPVFVRGRFLLGFANTRQREHVRPFPLAFGEFAKRPRHRSPPAKSFFERPRVIFSRQQIPAPRRHRSLSSHRLAPVSQQFTRLKLPPRSARFQPCGPHGIIPFRIESRDGIPGHSRAREKF